MSGLAQNGDSLFLGRQPILDRDQVTLGYSLMFQPLPERTTPASPTAATADARTWQPAGLHPGR